MVKLEDIQIRTFFKPGDLGYITYLHGSIYGQEYGFTLDFEAYVAETVADFSRQFDENKDRVWICEYQGEMIGFLSLFGRGELAQLRYFVLSKEFRGIGLGKKLMTLFLESLKECQYKGAFLLTADILKPARGLYEKFGFQLKEAKKSVDFSIPDTELRYELQL